VLPNGVAHCERCFPGARALRAQRRAAPTSPGGTSAASSSSDTDSLTG
jgi:hypothetical protein